MADLIRGSEGHTFNFGDLNIYAGPGLKGHKLPILAVRSRDDKKDQIVADFRNSTSARARATSAWRTASSFSAFAAALAGA